LFAARRVAVGGEVVPGAAPERPGQAPGLARVVAPLPHVAMHVAQPQPGASRRSVAQSPTPNDPQLPRMFTLLVRYRSVSPGVPFAPPVKHAPATPRQITGKAQTSFQSGLGKRVRET